MNNLKVEEIANRNAYSFNRFGKRHEVRAGSLIWFCWESEAKTLLQYAGMVVPYAAKNAYTDKKHGSIKTEVIAIIHCMFIVLPAARQPSHKILLCLFMCRQ